MKFKYRPEIDGLRAIAVLSVIIYHAGFEINISNHIYKILPGGFLGVDIFYVISGYLITFLILEKIKSNTFSFLEFYERRARRLLPVLFLVILVSIIAGYILMMPSQFKDLAGSAISSIFFLSNFWFFITDNYFAEESLLKPLLHTWSLSIEEQFYILFPPFLYLLYKKDIKNIKVFFICIIFVSLIFSTFGSIYYKNLNFYMLPSRIWELLVGAVIAHQHISQKTISKTKVNELILFFGLILILIPFFLFNDNTPHPSLFTSFVIIGTAIIINYNNNFGLVKNILSSKLFVTFGLISYSLYLWHYPVFAFKKIKSQSLSEFDKLELIFLVIILSILSYLFIEKPLRNRKFVLKKTFLIFISSSLLFLIAICSYVYIQKGLPQRYSSEILKLIDFNYDYKKIYQTGKCHIEKKDLVNKNFFKNCKIKVNKNKKNIYLWGDSLGAHLYPGIKSKYSKDYNIWQRTIDACKPFLINSEQSIKDLTCRKINNFILKEILEIKPDKIFISGFWFKKDLKDIKRIVETLKENNVTNIYLVGPSLRWHDPLPKILLKKYRISKEIPKYLNDKNHSKNFKLDKEFSDFAKKNLINYLSLIKILCKDDLTCLVKVGEEPNSITNWDENHFTEKASIFIFSKFID